MKIRGKIVIALATLAITGGMTSVAFANGDSTISRNLSNAGIVTAVGGLLGILGTQIQPILKIYLDNQRLQFDVQTAVKKAESERQMIIDRLLHMESRVDHLYEVSFPGHEHRPPPDLPGPKSRASVSKELGL